MKKQSQNYNNAGQSAIEVRKSHKHEVNLQKNSTLYFQIGLILCLLGTFALFEMEFSSNPLVLNPPEIDEQSIEVAMVDVKPYEPEVKPEPKKQPAKNLTDTYIEKPDDFVEPKLEDIITPDEQPTSDVPLTPEDLDPVIDIPDEVHVSAVEFVPIFPGCEKYDLNSERIKCLNEKMGKLVQKKFDTDIAVDYGLSGLQRISVEFKVDKTGAITDIRARAPHPKLEEEARRVANKIPKMIPGKMGVTPVNVIYSLPITFKVQD